MKNKITAFGTMSRTLHERKQVLLNDVWNFAAFMLMTIFSVLIFYSQTQNELLPFIILASLWLLFWHNTTLKGKIILVIASSFGYIHELLGVHHGYFTYLGGVIGGAPLWLIPGYGAIFWSSHNLCEIFHDRYSKKAWFPRVNHFMVLSILAMLVIDYVWLDLAAQPVAILLKFSLALMLFNGYDGMRMAFFTGFFTVLTEVSGELLGTWKHPEFSLFSLMAGYIFLLWVCITLADIVKGRKLWEKSEATAAFSLTSFYILLLLGIVSV